MVIADVIAAVERTGLAYLGAFRLEAGEKPEGARTLALVGMAGAGNWPAFASSPEYGDGLAHPLDRFSKRVIGELADAFGATALFPLDGPPFWPFQAWARRAQPVFDSPIKLLIHADHGVWQSFRGALALAEGLDLPAPAARANPCEACATRPCLSACPVGAFAGEGYDWSGCGGHLKREPEGDCMLLGCRARRACPVGQAYTPQQASFHMRAFVKAIG